MGAAVRHARGGPSPAVVVLVAMVATACSSGGGGQGAVSAGPATTAEPAAPGAAVTTLEVPPLTTVELPAPATAEPVETAPPREPRRIAYPSGGLKGSVFPPGDPAYEMLTSRRCGQLLARTDTWAGSEVPQHEIHLYRAAAHACLSDWEAAVAEFDQLAPFLGDFTDGCPSDRLAKEKCPSCEQAVLAWLTEVVDAYTNDPDRPPVLTASAEDPPC